MIKGIANRLGIQWGLSTMWTVMAEETLKSSTTASDVQPIWAVVRPNVLNSQGSMSSADFTGNKILRFADVKQSFINCISLLKTYLMKKGVIAIKKVIPQTILMKILKYYSSLILKLQK